MAESGLDNAGRVSTASLVRVRQRDEKVTMWHTDQTPQISDNDQGHGHSGSVSKEL